MRQLFFRLAVVAFVALPAAARADIFSPGELARPHAPYEGLQNCTKCHPAGEQLSSEKCLECHTELKGKVAEGKGFHGRMTAEEKATCHKCHLDHQGREFKMVNWGPGGKRKFDHQKTGWPLKGKHADVECAKCHEKRFIKDEDILVMLKKQPQRDTFLGTTKQCVGCHFDEHREQVDQKCESCHNEKAWKPAPGFDHDKTKYPLEGQHKKVACKECHPTVRDEETAENAFPAPVSMSFLKYAPLDFKRCTDCHKDPHDGKFGPRCEGCHTVQGWRIIKSSADERAFHEKTRYPLRGEHAFVMCRSCHGPFPGKRAKFKGLPFERCTDCHADGHLGQILIAKNKKAKGGLCEDCHSVEGFMPPKYDLEQHAKSSFPLEGAHKAASCGACHPQLPALKAKIPVAVKAELRRQKRPELFSFALFDYAKPTNRCDTCHGDPHGGQFGTKPCTDCHQTDAFTKATFDHSKTKFPLTGKHEKTACRSCHLPDAKGVTKYTGLEVACASCHADVHAGQFGKGPGAQGDACDRCHGTEAFKPSTFKHQPPFTPFLLDGQHAKAQCVACHPDVKVQGNVTVRKYRPLPQACEGCHADYHKGSFRGFTQGFTP